MHDIGTLTERGGSEWRTSFMETLPGNILQMRAEPVLLQAYLTLHGYDHIMGECRQTSEGTFRFSFKGLLGVDIRANISDMRPAPSRSFSGTADEGALPWLHILPVKSPKSGRRHKVSTIYQYYTAGGMPPSRCTSVGRIYQVPYAAQYWFYEKQRVKRALAIEASSQKVGLKELYNGTG